MTKATFSHITVIFIGAILFATSCTRQGVAPEPDSLAARIDSIISPLFPANEPGAVVVISLGDSILYNHSFGLARLDSVCPITDTTMMNIASSTKTFTAAAILKLAEEGKLSLDDKFIKFYPELNEKVFGEITLRNVLSHTSGIPDLRPKDNEQWAKYVSENTSVFAYGPDYRIYGKEREQTNYIKHVDSLAFKPGSRFERQDPPYMLLLGVIEEASGENFEVWMQRNIFEPAGIEYASYVNQTRHIARMAHGYCKAQGDSKSNIFRSKDGQWDEFDYGEADFFLTRADRGLYTNALDFTRWQHALNNGLVLSDESLNLLRTPLVDSDKNGEYCSLGINIAYTNGHQKLYHRSQRGGFSEIEATFPDLDLCYLVFSNRNDWDAIALINDIDEVLIKEGLINCAD
ncbi:MAG: beta-lactamase family protein [Muribaculaceae bacterium]|nr:beta-lactamase family protein [Muribaculaceae bacterium]